MKLRILLVLLVPLLVLAGCRQTTEATAENVEIAVALDTETPAIGDATLLVTVTTDDGTAVNDATVAVQGDMTHAGMVPVIPEPVSEAEEGVYSIPFEFTMGGDWIITVDVTLANGDTASTTYDINGVEGDMDDMDDMDMEGTEEADMDMDDMDMEGTEEAGMATDMSAGVSGAFLSISNNGEDDVTLLSASAEGAAGMVQVHETVVDDNDVASMQEMVDGIVIPAGETVELQPGGYHIMLMNLETGLVEGETVAITLEFSDDSSVVLDVPIISMGSMPEDGETVEAGDLSITGFWARATVVDMDMDMEGTEEADMDMESTEESE